MAKSGIIVLCKWQNTVSLGRHVYTHVMKNMGFVCRFYYPIPPFLHSCQSILTCHTKSSKVYFMLSEHFSLINSLFFTNTDTDPDTAFWPLMFPGWIFFYVFNDYVMTQYGLKNAKTSHKLVQQVLYWYLLMSHVKEDMDMKRQMENKERPKTNILIAQMCYGFFLQLLTHRTTHFKDWLVT